MIKLIKIKPLQLGNKLFPVNIVQGPLAGVSCAPFRLMAWKYSRPAFSCTEMISCKALLRQSKITHHRFIIKDPNEGPVCFQLLGNDPVELATATKIVTAHGADLIDLNCGCPVHKVRKSATGSSLLTDVTLLYRLISAMKQNTHLPVSIKIRVDGDGAGDNEKINLEIAQAVSDAGADFLVVHGRRWTDDYAVPCRYDKIQFFVEALKIPVIGNGDVACSASLQRMMATGCAGAMVGRAGIGQPWLIGKLIAEANNKEFAVPAPNEIAAIFIEQVEQLAQLLRSEKFAILQARALAKYYARGLRYRNRLCVAMNSCSTFQDLIEICSRYFV